MAAKPAAMRRLPGLILTAAFSGAILAPFTGGAVSTCATPVPVPESYARGDVKTLTWTQGSQQGGGYVIEVAAADALDGDGSFVDAELVRVQPGVPASWRLFPFEDLVEQRYFYHLRAVTKAGAGACTQSPWSATIDTTQDATDPTLALGTEPGRRYLAENVLIEGSASDVPTTAPTASGVGTVVVDLSSISLWGPLLPQPSRRSVTPDESGEWEAGFDDAQPGQYRVTVTAFDRVGNASQTAVLTITVVTAPHV